jgi:hypothetical protein
VSRSKPNANTPNPAVRWYEWNGADGVVRYYDKEKKETVTVDLPFTFLLLDEVATITGWHDPSQSGIYANQVRDTRTDPFVVKSFKGGTLAEGAYQAIKDRVNALGGGYAAVCYVGVKGAGGALEIATLTFKGAALGGWMDARKALRSTLYSKAITISGYTEGKKGKVVFRVPTFTSTPVSEATDAAAKALDETLQEWLSGYFARKTDDRADTTPAVPVSPDADDPPPPTDDDFRADENGGGVPNADDIPF